MGQASDSGVPSQLELIALILVASERGQEQAATDDSRYLSRAFRYPEPHRRRFIHSGPICHLLSTSRSCFLWFIDTECDGGYCQLIGSRILREANLLA